MIVTEAGVGGDEMVLAVGVNTTDVVVAIEVLMVEVDIHQVQ